MAHDAFISHSSSNRPVANAVCASLESAGIRCWIAPRDVMPGRSYSGEITRAIQQSRAFILIFSQDSNHSEQVLREVQLAANSRLHIVQFRIDAVSPSDDLEYYLSGPHWLDAVTPPLENHLGQLTASVKALLSLPRTEGTQEPAQAPPPPSPLPPPPPAPMPTARYDIPMAAAPPPSALPPVASNRWKIVALMVAALGALGVVALVIAFTLLQPKPPVAPAASPSPTVAASSATVKPEPSSVPQLSVAPPSANQVLTTEEAEVYVKEFNRDLERGDLKAVESYFDETVNYYSFGQQNKAFIVEQTRLYLAAVPVRAFVVDSVKVQPGPKPTIATLVFDARYSVRDAVGNPASGRTRSEWDVVRRPEGLKIIRSNWMVYPDTTPPR